MSQDAKEMMTIFIKIPVEHHRAITALANREERSMAAQVRYAIKLMLLSDAGLAAFEVTPETPRDKAPPFKV